MVGKKAVQKLKDATGRLLTIWSKLSSLGLVVIATISLPAQAVTSNAHLDNNNNRYFLCLTSANRGRNLFLSKAYYYQK